MPEKLTVVLVVVLTSKQTSNRIPPSVMLAPVASGSFQVAVRLPGVNGPCGMGCPVDPTPHPSKLELKFWTPV